MGWTHHLLYDLFTDFQSDIDIIWLSEAFVAFHHTMKCIGVFYESLTLRKWLHRLPSKH